MEKGEAATGEDEQENIIRPVVIEFKNRLWGGGTTESMNKLVAISTGFKDILKDITQMAEEFEARNVNPIIPVETGPYQIDPQEDYESANVSDTHCTLEVIENVGSATSHLVPSTSTTQKHKPMSHSAGGKSETVALKTFKIFVRNLPPGYKSAELLKLFQPFGKVIECEVFIKNYAFVHMPDEQSGRKAISVLNGRLVKGLKIGVQESRNTSSGPKHPIGNFGLQKVTTFKLFIANLPYRPTKEYVITLMEPFGRVVEVELFKNFSAFVHMEDEKSGRRAIEELNGKMVDDQRNLVVTESKNPEGPSIAVMKLLVKNVAENVTASDLRDLFSKYGLVTECNITPSSANEQRRAVVHLEALGDIRSAIRDMNGYKLETRALSVEPMFDKDPHHPNSKRSSEGSANQGSDIGFGFKSKPQPLFPSFKNQSRPPTRPRPLFGDSEWHLIPMPSEADSLQHNSGRPRPLIPPPSRLGSRGSQGFQPQQRRPYDHNYESDSYDDYYEEPFQGLSQPSNHDFESQESEEEWSAPIAQQPYQSKNYQQLDLPFGEREYCPPNKKAKDRFSQQTTQAQLQPRALMDLPLDDMEYFPPKNNNNTGMSSMSPPFQKFTPLNLPLGEREYFAQSMKGKAQPVRQLPPNQNYNRNQQSQQGADTETFFNDSVNQGGYYHNSQVPGQNFNNWAPPSSGNNNNRFLSPRSVNNFNANQHLQRPLLQDSPNPYEMSLSTSSLSPSAFPPGVDPSDYPNLKPGAKVYINGKGKVMVRGCRGGKAKKKKIGPLLECDQFPIPPQPIGLNPSFPGSRPPYERRQPRPGNADVVNNQDYSSWLKQKPWLQHAIPGTVKRMF